MSNEEFSKLATAESSTVVILKSGQKHSCYYGPVYTTRNRGDYSSVSEYWFLYQNKPRQCKANASGFEEV